MKLLMIFAALLLAQAALAEEKNEIQFLLGAVKPTNNVSIQGSDSLGTSGLAVGGRYLRETTVTGLQVGGEIMSLNPGSAASDTLITNTNSTVQVKSLAFMADAKLAKTDGTVRPWVLVGLGFHSTNMDIESAPKAGFVWTDTGTRETRTVVDSTKTGVAATLQGGLDFPVNDQFLIGAGIAWYALGSTTYDATPVARQFGLTGISGGISDVAFLVSANYRF